VEIDGVEDKGKDVGAEDEGKDVGAEDDGKDVGAEDDGKDVGAEDEGKDVEAEDDGEDVGAEDEGTDVGEDTSSFKVTIGTMLTEDPMRATAFIVTAPDPANGKVILPPLLSFLLPLHFPLLTKVAPPSISMAY